MASPKLRRNLVGNSLTTPLREEAARERFKMLKLIGKLKSRNKWALAAFLQIGLLGMVLQLRGALLLNIKETYAVSESLLGLIAPAGVLGFTISALTTGMIAGKINIKKFILIGVATTALTTCLISTAHLYPLFLVMIALSGLARGISGGLGRPFLGHLFAEKRGQIFNINEAVWAIGATCGPLLATLVLTFSTWRVAYLLVGLAFIPVFFLMLKTDLSHVHVDERKISFGKLWTILKNPIMIGAITVLFFNVGVEGGFFTWLPYYLSQHFPQSIANLSLSAFLAAYIPGRFINSWFAKKYHYSTLILMDSVIVILLLIIAFYFTSGYFTIACIVLAGFFISPTFPNLFSLIMESFSEHSGPMNGVVMTVDPLGFSLVPYLVGVIADSFSISFAMQFMLVPMSIVVTVSFFLRRKIL